MGFIADGIEIYQNFGEPKREFQSDGIVSSADDPLRLISSYPTPESNTLVKAVHVLSFDYSEKLYSIEHEYHAGHRAKATVCPTTIQNWIKTGQIIV